VTSVPERLARYHGIGRKGYTVKHVLTLTLALALALILGPAAAQPAAAQGASLVLYSGRSESLVGPIIEQFEAATGIDVQVRFAGTPQLAATLLEEGPNTPADVFYAQDPGGLGAVESLLGQVPERLLARVPEEFRSPEGLWAGISGRARVLVYNTNNVSESDLPDDIFDLTRPEWRGRLGWAPSNGSFQTMVTGMRQLWGEERTRAWLAGIQANDPLVFPNNSSQVAAAAQGEIDVGMVNHYYLFRFLAEEGEDFPARNYHPARSSWCRARASWGARPTARPPSGSSSSCSRRWRSSSSPARRSSTPWSRACAPNGS